METTGHFPGTTRRTNSGAQEAEEAPVCKKGSRLVRSAALGETPPAARATEDDGTRRPASLGYFQSLRGRVAAFSFMDARFAVFSDGFIG
jgi:hypothetical protein